MILSGDGVSMVSEILMEFADAFKLRFEISSGEAGPISAYCKRLLRSWFENELGEMVEGVLPVPEVMGVFVDLPDVRHVVLL